MDKGDLKLVQCQMRSMSKQIFSSASSSSPSKKSKSMRSSNLGNENCDSNTKDVKNEKNEDCSTLIDQTQIAELHNYREKLRHLEENFRSVLQEKERLQSKYDQLQSKMINSMTSVRSSMDDQDVELNRSPKKSSINDQNEIINNHQQSRQKFDNMIEINRNLSKENDQLLLENRYLKRKIDNDDEERCLLLDRLASYRELIDLHRRDDDLYEQRLLSDILPTNSGYDPVTCDIFKLNRNNITSGDGQGRRRDDDDEEVEEIAIGDQHQQNYRSTLKSPYNDYDQHRDLLIENRFVSDLKHRNNEINDNQSNKITTNAVAKNIDDKNIEDDNDGRRIMTIGGDENQLIQIGMNELNSSKTTILKSLKSNESIRNEDIGIDRFNSIDLHQRIEKMIAFDSINKMKVNKSNQIYLWHLLLATFQGLILLLFEPKTIHY
ncbi:hypothetical protein QR98_0061620 [Sarcoptes scabiei]|uniref:Uncharacterized protein n=1 Tax=Sarcoptes scabiei TaxID=52283 RepID=A0A132A9N0_SARSC|nr:hypothetical protein QR98_0061620 [Sarcoptes scabiei]